MEDKFILLSEFTEKLTEIEKKFLLWLLVREYGKRIKIPKIADTKEKYIEQEMLVRLKKSCGEISNMLDYELWK